LIDAGILAVLEGIAIRVEQRAANLRLRIAQSAGRVRASIVHVNNSIGVIVRIGTAIFVLETVAILCGVATLVACVFDAIPIRVQLWAAGALSIV
jgi:hypothetical protein